MSDLDHLFDQVKAFKRPSIDQWTPSEIVDIDIEISDDGMWRYKQSVIQRDRLVRLFSSLLRREEDDQFYLITPPVKYRVKVVDAPFIAVELKHSGKDRDQLLYLRTNVNDVVLVDALHPIQIETDDVSQQPRPYVVVRDGLRAKIVRSVFYQLAELLEPVGSLKGPLSTEVKLQDTGQEWGVYSSGDWFSFGKA